MSHRPLNTVWFMPRQTIREILSENPNLYVAPLIGISGIVSSLENAAHQNAGDRIPFTTLVMLCFLIGPLGGVLSVWVWTHLIRWTGQWLGGTADRNTIRTALAWSSVPIATSLAIWIVQLAVFGEELFTAATPEIDASQMKQEIYRSFDFMKSALTFWSLFLACSMIAEVQGFKSGFAGFGNFLLAGATLGLILLPIVLLLVAASR